MAKSNKQIFIQFLTENGACEEGLRWLKKQPNLFVAWNRCKRGDWLQWLFSLGHYGTTQRALYNKLFYGFSDIHPGILRQEKRQVDDLDETIMFSRNKKNMRALYSRRDRARIKFAKAIKANVTPRELKEVLKWTKAP